MRLFSSGFQAILRRVSEAHMDHTGQVQRNVTIRPDGGGYIGTWLPAGLPLHCRLTMGSSAAGRTVAEQPEPASEGRLVTPAGADVQELDRVLVTGRTRGVTWARLVTIDRVVAPRLGDVHRVCLCSLVAAAIVPAE